jgi:hypothetical protein
MIAEIQKRRQIRGTLNKIAVWVETISAGGCESGLSVVLFLEKNALEQNVWGTNENVVTSDF